MFKEVRDGTISMLKGCRASSGGFRVSHGWQAGLYKWYMGGDAEGIL